MRAASSLIFRHTRRTIIFPISQEAQAVLVLDIGNRNIKAAVIVGGEVRWSGSAPDTDLLVPELERIADPGAVAACSVRPREDGPLADAIRRLFGLEVAFLGRDLPAGIPVVCEEPEKVGADRLANSIAAFRRARGPVIVVDAGTAIAFDVISDKGEFLGGAIAPGLGTSLDALHERTALLPRVGIGSPQGAFGRNTVDAIIAGVVGGLPGLIDRVIEGIQAELPWRCTVYGTGGDIRWLAPRCRTVGEVVPTLTLEGVYLAWESAANPKAQPADQPLP